MTITPQDPHFLELAASLRALVRSDLLERTLYDELLLCLGDGAHVSPHVEEDALCLLEVGDCRLVARFVVPGPRDIVTTLARDTALAVAGGGPVSLRRFCINRKDSEPSFAPPRITEAPPLTLARGESYVFHAARETFLIEACETPAVLLALTSPLVARFAFTFDTRTREHCDVIAADLRSSRLELALDVLGEIGNADDRNVVTPLLDHEDHFVRWAAVGALASLDGEAGVVAIRNALSDPHPDVRDAAHNTLAELDASPAEE